MRWSGVETLTWELAATVSCQQAHATLLLYSGRLCVTRAERERWLCCALLNFTKLIWHCPAFPFRCKTSVNFFEKVRIVVY